jgi:GH15 family glucan-1,4-alpha-glucosidase
MQPGLPVLLTARLGAALEALLDAGYTDEALAFRDFLLRVGAGDPRAIQITLGDVSGQEAAEGE